MTSPSAKAAQQIQAITFEITAGDIGREAMFYDEHQRVLKLALSEAVRPYADLEAATRHLVYEVALMHNITTMPVNCGLCDAIGSAQRALEALSQPKGGEKV